MSHTRDQHTGAGKGKKKPPPKKGKKGKAEPAALELKPVKPLSAAKRAAARRRAFGAELAAATKACAAVPVAERLEYSIAREVLLSVVETIPGIAGELRARLQLPLRPDRDAEPDAETQAEIDAIHAAAERKRRRAERRAAG